MGTNELDDTGASVGLRRLIWRWHFYAGLIVSPVLVVLAVTGAIYLFDRQIEALLYPDLIRSQATKVVVAASEQEAAIVGAFPDAVVTRYVPPRASDRTAEWVIRTRGQGNLSVFVDPSDASIKGTLDADTRLMNVVREIHAGLFLGEPGRYVVELAACWGLILLITGAFLWWPRGGRGMRALAPRLDAKGRTFWKDLHAVPAIWNLPLVAFLILSGLPWSIFWGVQLAKLGTLSAATAPTPNFIDQPTTTQNASTDLPWTIRHAPAPVVQAGARYTTIDDIMRLAEASGIAKAGLRVIYPQVPGDTFVLSFVPATAQGQRTINVDPATGAIVRDIGWDGYSPLGMTVEFGVMTHMGLQFGLINQLLMLAVCVVLVFTIGAGLVMWWRRRPKGGLGAPDVPEGAYTDWGIAAIALALGILFPLAGASMVAILLADIAARTMRRAHRG